MLDACVARLMIEDMKDFEQAFVVLVRPLAWRDWTDGSRSLQGIDLHASERKPHEYVGYIGKRARSVRTR